MKNYYLDVLIIGAGQTGLTTAYYLKKTKLSFLLVDANAKIGDSWRKRYDSLRLLTPDSNNSLPGLSLGGNKETYSTKDNFADYLERYASYNSFRVSLNTKIKKLQKKNGVFIATAEDKIYHARNIVAATGAFSQPFIPQIAKKASPAIFQIHSDEYKNASKIPKGNVLVVGGGNSGAQIAVELAKTHSVTLSSKRKLIFDSKYDFLYRVVASFFSTELIRKIVDVFSIRKIYVPQIEDLLKSRKISLVQELIAIKQRDFFFKGGLSDQFNSVIWATGFQFDYTWIKIREAFDSNGRLLHKNGVSVVRSLYIVYPTKDYGFIQDLPAKAENLVKQLIAGNKNG